MMRTAFIAALTACTLGSGHAQNFSNTYFFGDSNLDSGRYLYLPQGRGGTLAPQGAGAHTTNPDLEWSQILGGKFGKVVTPNTSFTPNGNNFGAGGAVVATLVPGGPQNIGGGNMSAGYIGNIWSLSQQISTGYKGYTSDWTSTSTETAAQRPFQSSYLQQVNGVADPNALYTIWLGVNNLKLPASTENGVQPINGIGFSTPATNPTQAAQLNTLAGVVVDQVSALKAARARYFVVGDTPGSTDPTNNVGQTRAYYDNSVFQGLHAAGVNFIPADFRTVDNFVIANAAQFGITKTSASQYPCPVISYRCILPEGTGDTYFDADANGHRTGTIQKIQADYIYSLVTAPSLISYLPENAVKTGLARTASIQEQADLSLFTNGSRGVNAWVTGDITSIQLDNYANFPSDPNVVTSVQAGVDYKFARGVLAGVAASAGRLRSDLGTDWDFRQTETSVTVYGALDKGFVWANVGGTFGSLDYKVNRMVPIGITEQVNSGKTSGDERAAFGQVGLRFHTYGLTHGPLAGFVYQDIHVDGYTESGSALTNLSFTSQSRQSSIGQFGYRVGFDYGPFHPFGQVTYNHDFASDSRQVGANVLSLAQYGIFSPTYFLPAVKLGEDWGTATAGLKYEAAPGFAIVGSFSGDFAQDRATVYGGRIGLNVAF